ncbi:MATE family efflux transporter [Noviherbaspirillum autotrophicum]|uniref:Multidrug-efflux transporter n=1 Tax=Noviherbaspirillum autotrophicum TaxID=709839 RepID=A0A0C1YIW5_9BURK|nr:MATE family efflux transporter [Noviherbaspirillum autotrophicum]KIF80402.1 multidrug transporter MatE [Noviherbaspirillum autotrophicum]
MTPTQTPPRFTLRIAALAWPILIGQLAVIANGVIDTAMTSRFSATDLATLALGASIYISIFVGLNGVLAAMSPVIGQLFGAQRFQDIGAEIKQGIWLALFLTIAGCIALAFPQPLLALAHASPELNEKSMLYLRILALALPATLGFRIYASLNTAIGQPKMVMALQVGALALKVPLNALFIFGGFGIPALGGPGCAVATAVIAWTLFLVGGLLLRTHSSYRAYGIFGTGLAAPKWAAQRELLKLGIPMGLSYLIEVTAFTFMALFIARLGATVVAGHQITANFGTVLYMLPLSIANATGILVAQAVGAREFDMARRIGFAGIRLAAILSVSIGGIVWLAREAIIRAYTPDASVAATALPLFVFIAFYQLFDSVQVTTAFVLRAYKVAVVPTLMYAFALWGVGLGGGYVLGLDPFGFSPPIFQGAAGFWMGNSTSLALVAAGLLWYLHLVQRNAGHER